ncbi:MAG: ankyrin repeat domain-containing protein [Pseudomonadota bacterium]
MNWRFSMNTRRIPVIMKWWVFVVLILAPLPDLVLAGDKANLDEQLRKAATDGDLALVRRLVDRGSDIHAQTRDGVTILMNAAIGGNLEVVKFLVGQGLDVNAKTSNGDFSVLLWAALAGNLKVVKFLIDQGADINATDSRGKTILGRAKLLRQTEIVKYLELRGAK